jgi:phosphohistidine swiveling domain-containing protein
MTTTHNQHQPAPGQTLPVPADFPVSWDDPADAKRLWRLDPIHYPRPLPVLEHELHQGFDVAGANGALESYNFPFRWMLRAINGYLYNSVIPLDGPPEIVPRLMRGVERVAPGLVRGMQTKAVASLSKRYVEPMEARLDDLGGYWEGELLPEIQSLLVSWREFDLEGAGWEPLLAHLEWTLGANVRAGVLHGLIAVPLLYGWSEYDELYNELFPEAGPFDSHKLSQGFDHQFLRGDRWLWQLGRKALTMPAVQAILEREAAAEVIPALGQSAAGQVFLEELNRFIAEHGHRNAFMHYSARGWQEDPTPVIELLKDYITQPDRDMAAELAAEGMERERSVAEARARLQGYPEPVQAQFDRRLEIAQAAAVIHNDHAYWLDCACVYEVRRVMLAFGQRFVAAGILEDREQIMHLRVEEIKSTGAGLAQGRAQSGLQELVAERKAALARFAGMQPPQQLGTVPWIEPPADEPMFRAGQKFIGATVSGVVDGNGKAPRTGEVRGNAGSPGLARGVAKVVRSLAEAEKLAPGDILIAETTAPAWTPLFATVAAVVTDTGGILSHSAVVAREYRIPAVVGTLNATDTFRDGQRVEVDGDKGIVRILE